MTFSTITPMQRINSLDDIKGGMNILQQPQNTMVPNDFRNVLSETIGNVQATDEVLAKEQYLFATGQSQDTHSLNIAATQAQISLELLTSIRDRSLESYNELIRMSV